MKYLGKQSIFDDLMIGGVLLTPPDPVTYSYELTLPNDDGTAGQVLSTDGNGILSWVSNSAAVPNALTIGTGLDLASGNTTWTGSAAETIQLDLTEVIATDSNNRLLTSDGDGTLTAEAKLSWVATSLNIGEEDGTTHYITRVQNQSGTGGDFRINAGLGIGTNLSGGDLILAGGGASGNGTGGAIKFLTIHQIGSSGTALNITTDETLVLSGTNAHLGEDVTLSFEGATDNGYETTLTVTDPTADRTVTFQNATGTVALTSDIPAAYTLPLATTSVRGGVELGSDTDLTETYQTGVTGASGKTYPVQLNAANQMGVSVPWADTKVTLNGTTVNGVATFASTDTLDIESTLQYVSSSNQMTIGDATASGIEIKTPLNSTGEAGSEWSFTNGNAGAGTDIRAGSILFNSGMGTGDTTGGMYSFFGGGMGNAAGGTTYSTARSMVTIYSQGGSANTTLFKMDDLNSTRDYFDISVTTDAVTTFRNVKGSIGGGSPDMIIDSQGKLELNADAGTITFADSTAPLAKIDTNGISFKDNTGAGVVFEGATDNANQTTLSVIDPTGTRAINLPDADGTVALTQSTARLMVSLRTDDAYVMYLGNVNRWYHSNRVFSSIGTQSTLDGASVTDSVAITSASYIATRPCTVHGIVVTWYPSATSDVEFEILKVPLVDNSVSNVTFSKMTHTNHNGSFTANRNYVKAFAITADNTLIAGQGLALVARRTSGSNTYMNGGQIYAEIEITG